MVRNSMAIAAIAYAVAVAAPPDVGAATGCVTHKRGTQLAAASAQAAQLVAAGHPGAAQAVAVVDRAKHSCSRTAGYALAVTKAVAASGNAAPGTSFRYGAYALVAADTGGAIQWQLSWPASLPASQGGAERRATLNELATAGLPIGAITVWPSDPTQAGFDADAQVAVVAALARDARTAQPVFVRSVDAIASRRFAPAMASGGTIGVASRAASFLGIAQAHPDAHTRAAAARLAHIAAVALDAPTVGAWSRLNDTWTTRVEEQQLGSLSASLAKTATVLHLADAKALGTIATRVAAHLHTRPTVSLLRVPRLPFYPLPADGVLDTATLALNVDKPSIVTAVIYGSAGAHVATIIKDVLPGTVSIAWAGISDAGPAMPPGSYRWSLRVTDRAGNRRMVPGVGTFMLAVDRTPPRIVAGAAAFKHGLHRRRIRLTWRVVEPLSPKVTIRFAIRGQGIKRSVSIPNAPHIGRMMVGIGLPAGTFRVILTAVDGSGNRSSRAVSSITIH